MTTQNIGEKRDSGGASNNAPQLEPLFTYAVRDIGDVKVYVFVHEGIAFAVVSVKSEIIETVYTARALEELSRGEVNDLIREASDNYYESRHGALNPFDVLWFDERAMRLLTKRLVAAVLCAVGDSSEDEDEKRVIESE